MCIVCVCVCVRARAFVCACELFARDQDLGQVKTTVNVSNECSRVSNTSNQCGERVVPTLIREIHKS